MGSLWNEISALHFTDFYSSNLELVAVITGILNVLLLTFARWPRLQWFNWPLALISTAIYFYLFYEWEIYGNMILQPFFLVICSIGLWTWRGQLRGVVEGVDEIPTTWASWKWFSTLTTLAIIGVIPTYFVLQAFTGTSPAWDGFIFTLSVAASILQYQKKVQSWFLWIAVDIIAVPFHWSHGYPATSFLYFVYGVVCFYGLWQWWQATESDEAL